MSELSLGVGSILMANDDVANSGEKHAPDGISGREKKRIKKAINEDSLLVLRLEEKIAELNGEIEWLKGVLPTGKDDKGTEYDKKELQARLKESKKSLAAAETELAECKERIDANKQLLGITPESEAAANERLKKTTRAQRRLEVVNFLLKDTQELLDNLSETESEDTRASMVRKIKSLTAERDRLQAKIDGANAKNTIPEDPIEAYVALLHAKTTTFRTKFQKEIIGKSEDIAKNFRDALASQLKADDGSQNLEIVKQNLDAMQDISAKISIGLQKSKGFMEKAITAFRKPGASTARLLLGLALMAGGIAIHGLTIGAIGLSIAPLIAAPVAIGTVMIGMGIGLGIVGRFLGADAIYDKIHLAITGRAKNGETAIAARVFRNDAKRIWRSITKTYITTAETERENSDTHVAERVQGFTLLREISAENFDKALQGYASNIRKNKFFKTTISVAAAAVVPLFQLFGAEHAVPASPAPKAPLPADSTVVSPDSAYVAPADTTVAHADSVHAKAPSKVGVRIRAPVHTIQDTTGAVIHADSTTIKVGLSDAKGSAGVSGIHGSGAGGAKLYPHNLTTVTGDASYAVGKGQSIWHLAEKIAEKNVPNLSGMPHEQQLSVVDAIKDAIVKNPSDFGLKSTFLTPGTKITCTIGQMKDALVAGGVKVEFPSVSNIGGIGTFKPEVDSLGNFIKPDTLGGFVKPDTLGGTIKPDSLLQADSLRTGVNPDSLGGGNKLSDLQTGRQDSGFWGDVKQAFGKLFGAKPKPMPLPKQRGVAY